MRRPGVKNYPGTLQIAIQRHIPTGGVPGVLGYFKIYAYACVWAHRRTDLRLPRDTRDTLVS